MERRLRLTVDRRSSVDEEEKQGRSALEGRDRDRAIGRRNRNLQHTTSCIYRYRHGHVTVRRSHDYSTTNCSHFVLCVGSGIIQHLGRF